MTGLRKVVVVAMVRTPFGRFCGALGAVPPAALGAFVIDALLTRSKIDRADVEGAYLGIGMIGGSALTVARQAVLRSTLPQTTPSLSVDRACCSGMTAIGLAYRHIAAGFSDILICGGVESLSQTPMLMPRRRAKPFGQVVVDEPLLMRGDAVEGTIAAYTSEEALRNGISRQSQDEWALRSHNRYFAAEAQNAFALERVPFMHGAFTLDADESPRRDTSLAALAALPTVNGSSTITGGNAPGLNDGAAALILMTDEEASRRGLDCLAEIKGYAQVSGAPTSGTSMPAVAIRNVSKSEGIKPLDLDAIEINEAFAATPLVSTLKLGDGVVKDVDILRERTNAYGGAVAIGHPLGASGARIAMTLINRLRKSGGGVGAASICGGFGQGDALLISVQS
jgi:acetyl-CoA C-acetyltransferase